MFYDLFRSTGQADVFYILLTALIFLVMWIEFGADRFKKWYSSRDVPHSIFLGVVIAVASSFVLIVDNLLYVERIAELSGMLLGLNVAVAVVFGPFIEELVYRGAIIDILKKWLKAAIAVPVSAAIFSLVHVPVSVLDFFLIFVIGICFGAIYWADRSLIPSTIAHSLSNVAVYIFIR